MQKYQHCVILHLLKDHFVYCAVDIYCFCNSRNTNVSKMAFAWHLSTCHYCFEAIEVPKSMNETIAENIKSTLHIISFYSKELRKLKEWKEENYFPSLILRYECLCLDHCMTYVYNRYWIFNWYNVQLVSMA